MDICSVQCTALVCGHVLSKQTDQDFVLFCSGIEGESFQTICFIKIFSTEYVREERRVDWEKKSLF